jgi:ribosome maturation factor RimP
LQKWASAHFFVARTANGEQMSSAEIEPADSGTVEDRVRKIAGRVAASEGMEIVDVEWRGSARRGLLRIFIDKPGGVTHADCELVSRQMSAILDVEDFIPGAAYSLEVSSPGLDRKLVKLEDFRRFAGRKVRVKLREPLNGRQQFTGLLKDVEDGLIVLEAPPADEVRFGVNDVELARLVVEL